MTTKQQCHINRPPKSVSTGFVFICPGRYEEKAGRPCAGQTGKGLDDALSHLTQLRHDLCPSLDRYDYLITNAWPHVEFVMKTGRSLPEANEIAVRKNIERLRGEIEGLSHIVACGGLAHLAVRMCTEFLGYTGQVAYVAHTSRQALGCPTADQYDEALHGWARRVVGQFRGAVL